MTAQYLGDRKIIHIRKDGTRQDSMEGVEVPKELSDICMRIIYESAREMERKAESK